MAAPWPQKLLKIYSLRTTNAIKMKIGTIVCLHFTKDLGVQGCGPKTSEKIPQNEVFWLIFLEFLRLYQKP